VACACPTGLPLHDNSCLGALIGPRMRIRKGTALFNANDSLTTLYAVRCGSFKTSLNSAEGQGVVINFWMPGDVLGLDAIATDHHVSTRLPWKTAKSAQCRIVACKRWHVTFQYCSKA
jgi:CRP-like cAMP-binding protein